MGIFPGPIDSKLRNKLLKERKNDDNKKLDLSGNSSVNLIDLILKIKFKKLSGKLISSRFDKIKNLSDSNSLFTLRRIDNKNYHL